MAGVYSLQVSVELEGLTPFAHYQPLGKKDDMEDKGRARSLFEVSISTQKQGFEKKKR